MKATLEDLVFALTKDMTASEMAKTALHSADDSRYPHGKRLDAKRPCRENGCKAKSCFPLGERRMQLYYRYFD